MVGEAVQQLPDEAFRAEDFRPLVEGQVGGYHDGSPRSTPSSARVAGYSKRDAQEWLHEHCRVPLQKAIGSRGVPKGENGKWLYHPELQSLENDPDATIPMLESPEQYLLFVTGGTTHYANFFYGTYGTYGIATRPVEEF